MNLCCVFIRSIIVYLFFTFALMTFVQSPFINTCFGKPLCRLQSWTKLFLPQSAHNPSLEVHLWKEINTRQIEIGALTERMKYSGSTGGGETNSSWGGTQMADEYYPNSENYLQI